MIEIFIFLFSNRNRQILQVPLVSMMRMMTKKNVGKYIMSCGSAYVFSCHKNTPSMLLFCICTCNYLHQKVEKRNINTILAVSNLPITYVRTSKIYFILTYSSEIRGLCSIIGQFNVSQFTPYIPMRDTIPN